MEQAQIDTEQKTEKRWLVIVVAFELKRTEEESDQKLHLNKIDFVWATSEWGIVVVVLVR